MSSQTQNLHFVLPTGDENLSRTDYNDNWEKTDDAYGEVDGNISKLADGLAILANGNTHPAIEAGRFVYVRKHSNLAEGLYTALSAISANATLSASNLVADSNGGLNSLSAQMANNEYFHSGDTVTIRDAFLPGVFTGASNFRSMIYLSKKMSNITPTVTCEYFEIYYNGADKVETDNITSISISPVWVGTPQQSTDKNAFVINISGNFSGYSGNTMACGVFRGQLSF